MRNPVEKMSPRLIRLSYTIAALLVLSLTLIQALDVMFFRATSNDQCGWLPRKAEQQGMVITDIAPGGVADRAGLRNGDILLRINGKEFKDGVQAMALINKVKRNEYAEYLIERDRSTFTTRVQILKVFDVRYLAMYLLGLGFLLVGCVVVLTRPQGKIQRMFGRYALYSMLFFGLSYLNLGGVAKWKLYLLGAAFVVSWVLALPNFITFFLHFPVRKKILERKWVKPLLYGYSAITVLPFPLGAVATLPAPLPVVLNFTPLSFFVLGLVIFIVTYFRSIEKSRRAQLRPILIGAAAWLLSFGYAYVIQTRNPFTIFTQPVLLIPMFFVVVLPWAFGYSIFRYRLMDIDLVIKGSLVYAVVTAVLAGVYLLLVYSVGSLLTNLLNTEESQLVSLFAFIVLAFAFDPLKRKAQEWIDRLFYQERYNYQKALLEFSQELPRLMDLDQLLSSVINRITSTMHIEKMAVVLCDGKEGCPCSAVNMSEGSCAFGREPDGLIALLRETRMPQSFALLATEPESYRLHERDRERILRSGIVLAVPMFIQGRLIGMINVGPKLSGKVYSQEDIDLLSTVASQAAIAIENARLHKEEIENQKIEEELALARNIQQGLLPKSNPVIEGLDIAGVSIPASTVGGDYFDYIDLGPKKLLVAVGDVSGKGMSAALYMSKIQGMIQALAPMYERPKDMLIQVNRRIYDGIERKSFITMMLAQFDLERGEVMICRAGHNRALIGVNGTLEYVRGGGIGLGLERGPIFENELEEIRRPLAKDGIFVFYTDGLTEAMNDRHAQFGEETVYEIVKSKRGLAARELQQTILTSVEEFRGSAEQNDDLTLVVVKSFGR